MLIKKRYNLTYCTNIFKEKNWKALFYKLNVYIKILKLNFKKKFFGISLCVSKNMTIDLEKNISNFKIWIKKNNVYIFLINGFVYKTFHQKKIKENIYLPDWTSSKRVNYTINLINILNKLMTNRCNGGISTLPISFKLWIKFKNNIYIFLKSAKYFSKITKILMILNKKQNKIIYLDIEPEPRCTIETINEFIIFFENWFIPTLRKYLKTKNSEKFGYKHIRLCYDICHFSVNFENHKNIINILNKTKIKIGRIQISSALKFKNNKVNNLNKSYIKILKTLNCSPFLHQTTEKFGDKIIKHMDFKHIIKDLDKKLLSKFKIHFHVPVYIKEYEVIKTTQNEILQLLRHLNKIHKIQHIEIETYTHSLISKISQLKSIIKEYNWTIDAINKNL